MKIPGFSSDENRQLDARAIALGVPSIVLMEHASLGATRLLDAKLGGLEGKRVRILCGPGNNGGDGYAMARHLTNGGAKVELWDLMDPTGLRAGSDPDINRHIAVAMGIEPVPAWKELPPGPLDDHDATVDAIFGTGLNRAPGGRFREAIERISAAPPPVLAVDLPSGLDADRGVPHEVAVEAAWTATFGLPKTGFFVPGARRFTGEVFCVPIGAPRTLLPAGVPAYPAEPHHLDTEVQDP